ncbi:hypothetical protein [Desertivirga arenae]|uniref:hypothetical protein n=1 Tax=Desertivirga arenae TaxID=2810309 RepID=UPI001A969775|nr:hypothetical protein [Pedobacter sp. SYSU D00823]
MVRAAIATFNIEGCFPLIGRGIVIFGEILNGEVKSGDVLNLVIKGQAVQLEVISVEDIRMGAAGEEKVSLLVEPMEDWTAVENHFAFIIPQETLHPDLVV